MRRKWLQWRSSLVTAAERSRRTGMTCACSFSGRVITGWRFSKHLGRTLSCTAPRWRNGSWRRRRSTGGSRRCVASIGSLTLTDGIPSNPAQYVRRPKVQPGEGHGMDRGELGAFLFAAERFDRDHAALAVLLGLNGLRVSEACGTNIEDLGLQRGHRTLRILGKRDDPATLPLVPRTARTIDLAVGECCEGPILRRRGGQRLDRRTAHRWVVSIGKRAGLGAVHPHMLRAGFIMAALDAGVPLRDVQLAARHAHPRTTTIYDRRRQTFDGHAAYVLVARRWRLDRLRSDWRR